VFGFSVQFFLSDTFLILRRIWQDVIHVRLCNVPAILIRFSKNIQIANVMKIGRVGAELFHADGRTDRQTDRHDDPNSRFSQFCEREYKIDRSG
jgi:hypothetical protein